MSEEERPTAVVPPSPRDLVADEPPPDALLGVTLHDTYNVTRFLAEGGMGRVYEAQHTRITTKRFAIKVLHAALKHSMDVRMRFRREAEAAAAVDHPNIVGVHDFGYTPDGRPYLVSDFLEGKELYALLEGGKSLPVGFSVGIAMQVCNALDAAHEKGVIHRDLKPANVFLVGPPDAPDVRVLDFGLSKILELADATDTQTGTVMGTPSYMSPEQAKGERADHRADIYGVGAVLYACLTGRPPYEEESPHQTVVAVMTKEPVRPCLINPAVPPELEVVVQRAMAHAPADRYASMRELEEALAPFAVEATFARRRTLASSPTSPTNVSASTVAARGIRRRAIGWFALGGVVFVAAAVAAAIGAFPWFSSARLTSTEVLLGSFAIAGSLFTPAILVVLSLRRRYWNNSAKMITLVEALRAPILAACAVYGVASVAGRVLDATSAYMPGVAPNASGWVGWAPFLFALGLLAAVAVALRRRVLGAAPSALRRFLAGPLLVGGVVAASVALTIVGYRESARSASAPPQPSGAAAPSVLPDVSQRAPLGPSAAPSAVPSAVPSSDVVPERAPDADVARATAGGAQALMDLQLRFPKDPRVLKALALALGKEPSRASEMLRVLDSLFVVAPEEANDAGVYALVEGAALTPTTSQRALDMMKTSMGAKGADLLFELLLDQPLLRTRARTLLETAEAQRNFSPALKVAYDLYTASSCAARVGLLPQAIRDGDERSIAILSQSTARTMHNCGPKRNKWCPAQCDKDAPQIDDATRKIQERLGLPVTPAPAPSP